GLRIAFLRTNANGARVVVIVSARGGPERVLQATQTESDDSLQYSNPRYFNSVSWTSDGNYVLFADRAPGSTSAEAIFACSIATGQRYQLTFPRDFTDAEPELSPDGRYLGFVRRVAAAWTGYVFAQRLDGLRPAGEPRQVTPEPYTAVFSWVDNENILYDSN